MFRNRLILLTILVYFALGLEVEAQQVGDTTTLPSGDFHLHPVLNIEDVKKGDVPKYGRMPCEVPSGTTLKVVHDWKEKFPVVCESVHHPCLVVKFTVPLDWKGIMPSCPWRDRSIYSPVSRFHWDYYKQKESH